MAERGPDRREPIPEARGAARLRGFKLHLGGYFLLMMILALANLLLTPDTPWFVWPMVGWGSILAIHAAFVMGLFDILGPRK
jgi:2TM domain